MAEGFITRRGGGGIGGLNFEVVGGTTQPTSPKENTIWVNTDIAITEWVFSSAQPTGSDGMVWFYTSTVSPAAFNALKKNELQIYPIYAKQYIDGTWVDVQPKTYQNGNWVDWILVIFNENTPETDFNIFTRTNGQFSVTNGTIVISYADFRNSEVIFARKERINTSGYTKIILEGNFSGPAVEGYYPEFGLCSTIPTEATIPTYVSKVRITQAASTKQTYSLSVDGYQGEYYFVFSIAAWTGKIYSIHME